LALTFADGEDVAARLGQTYQLFNWDGVSPSGTFALSSFHGWDTSQLYSTGNVTLTAALVGSTLQVHGGLVSTNLGGAGIALLKSTSATATLSGNNTYSGGTTVSGGTLIVANVNALGTGGLTIDAGATAKLQAGLSGPVELTGLTIAGGAAPTTWLADADLNSAADNAANHDVWSNGVTNPTLAAVDSTTGYGFWSTGSALAEPVAPSPGSLTPATAEPVAPSFQSPASVTPATAPVPEPATIILALAAMSLVIFHRRASFATRARGC
jgi:autotransporter-associated beta strand protein